MALIKTNARSASALDATILTGNLPAISGASLTGVDSGSLAKLLTTDVSGSTASVSFNSTYITSTYRDYLVVISDMHHTTGGGANLQIQISDNNGSSYKSASSYRSVSRGKRNDGTVVNSDVDDGSYIKIFPANISGNESEEKSSIILNIFDPLSTSSYFTCSWSGQCFTTTGNQVASVYGAGGFRADVSSAINNIKIYPSTGNLNHGRFTLYGRTS